MVAELVDASGQLPRWGADNEDKTPIMRNFLRACQNLTGCFRGDLNTLTRLEIVSIDWLRTAVQFPLSVFQGWHYLMGLIFSMDRRYHCISMILHFIFF